MTDLLAYLLFDHTKWSSWLLQHVLKQTASAEGFGIPQTEGAAVTSPRDGVDLPSTEIEGLMLSSLEMVAANCTWAAHAQHRDGGGGPNQDLKDLAARTKI